MNLNRNNALLFLGYFLLLFLKIGVAKSGGQAVHETAAAGYQIVPAYDRASCLDVAGVSKLNGATVQIWHCGGSAALNQIWSLSDTGDGYAVRSANSGLCLGIASRPGDDRMRLQQGQCAGALTSNWLWRLKVSANAVQLISMQHGTCLDLGDANTTSPGQLGVSPCDLRPSPGQLWSIVDPASPSASSPREAPPAAIGRTFFGMTTLDFRNVEPRLDFGTTRTWDSYPFLDWAEANPARGVFHFAPLDAFLQQAEQHGRDVIYTFGRTPYWASSKPHAPSPYGPGQCAPPADLQSWDDYVTAVVTHAKGRIHYWELWNEPQDTAFYCGDVATLVTMAHHAYSIIKQVDPTAQIITPSVTAASGPAWLSSYLAQGGGSYADIMSFHGYSSSTAEDIQPVIERYQSVLAAHGQADKPLWDTEADWSGDPSKILQGADERAAFLARFYILHWSHGVSRVIWYAYDGGATWGGLWDRSRGLHPDGAAYSVLQRWLLGASMPTPCQRDVAGTWTCQLARAGGYHGLLIWNSTTSVNYPADAIYATLHSLDGRSYVLSGGTVKIGSSPILLETQTFPSSSGQ